MKPIFSPATELGRYVTVMRRGDFPEGLSHTNFVGAQPAALIVKLICPNSGTFAAHPFLCAVWRSGRAIVAKRCPHA